MSNFLLPIISQKIVEKQPLVLLAKGSRRQKMEELIEMLSQSISCTFGVYSGN